MRLDLAQHCTLIFTQKASIKRQKLNRNQDSVFGPSCKFALKFTLTTEVMTFTIDMEAPLGMGGVELALHEELSFHTQSWHAGGKGRSSWPGKQGGLSVLQDQPASRPRVSSRNRGAVFMSGLRLGS